MAISCDPSDVANAARCFASCIPDQLAVRSYLLCQYEQKTECCPPVGPDNPNSPAQTQTTIDITWTKSASPNCPITGFLIKWGPSLNDLSTGSATVGPNTLSFTITGLSASTTVFFKIWSLSGACLTVFPIFSSATTSAPEPPLVTAWRTRVINNGGPDPVTCVPAVITWYNALVAAGIDTLMKDVNFFCPDSLISALTPFFVTSGANLWSVVGGAGTVSAAGLRTTSLAPDEVVNFGGAVPNYWTTGTAGLTWYGRAVGQKPTACQGGTGSANQDFYFYPNAPASLGVCYTWPTAIVGAGAVDPFALNAYGFLSMNRISTTDFRYFWTNGVVPLAQAGATFAGASGAPPAANTIQFGSLAQLGGRFLYGFNQEYFHSFIAAHLGLTSVQLQALFNATQALRQAFGGGFT